MKFVLLLCVLAGCLSAQKLQELCAACHNEPASDFESHKHFAKGLSCDACHGASAEHRQATGHKPPDRVAGPSEQPVVCGACHAAQRKDYEVSKHGKAVAARSGPRAAACTTCHGTHSVRTVTAMATQCARCHAALPESCKKAPAVAAKLVCAGCHDPHRLLASKKIARTTEPAGGVEGGFSDALGLRPRDLVPFQIARRACPPQAVSVGKETDRAVGGLATRGRSPKGPLAHARGSVGSIPRAVRGRG